MGCGEGESRCIIGVCVSDGGKKESVCACGGI